LFLSIYSCKNDNVAEEKDPILTELGGENYAEYLRTPVNKDGSLDSTKMPRITFDLPIHDFGTLTEKDKQSHSFTFTNTSEHNLYLMNVKTSCGCTVASYDEGKIEPGEGGEIKINYDPKNRSGLQEKKIIVTSNAYPNTTELTIIAEILKD
jgi:hypothetical protein